MHSVRLFFLSFPCSVRTPRSSLALSREARRAESDERSLSKPRGREVCGSFAMIAPHENAFDASRDRRGSTYATSTRVMRRHVRDCRRGHRVIDLLGSSPAATTATVDSSFPSVPPWTQRHLHRRARYPRQRPALPGWDSLSLLLAGLTLCLSSFLHSIKHLEASLPTTPAWLRFLGLSLLLPSSFICTSSSEVTLIFFELVRGVGG